MLMLLVVCSCSVQADSQAQISNAHPLAGVEWERVEDSLIPTDSTILSIATNDSIVVANTANQILSSPDGVHWASQPTSFAKYVECTGREFFLFGNSLYYYTSGDGSVWSEHKPKVDYASAFQSLTWCDSLFLASSGGQRLQAFLTSRDGVNWTNCYSSGHIFALASLTWHGLIYAVGDRVRSSTDGSSWRVVDSSAQYRTRWFHAMAANDSTIVAAGDYGLIMMSRDGDHWDLTPQVTDATIRSMLWTGSLFVAVGGTFGTRALVMTSPDGYTWTKRLEEGGGILLDIVRKGDSLIAVGEFGSVYVSAP